MNNFWIPQPNILKICTFVIGTMIKKSVKFCKMPFFLSKVINFAGRGVDHFIKCDQQTKAMRKTGFSGFLCFAKDERYFFSYSNLNPKIHSASVLAKISRNKYGSKCETRSMEPLYENIQIYMSNTKITIIIVIFVQKCGRGQLVNQFLG